MSGILDVLLEPRLGPRKSARVYRFTIGSDVVVWLDVRSERTGALVPGVAGLAALYWQPGTRDNEAAAQALVPVEAAPGSWQVVVPTSAPGTYVVFWTAAGQTAEIVFDVSTAGSVTRPGAVAPFWSDVEAAGAAAGRSAVLPEARRLVDEYAVPAVDAAVGDAMLDFGDKAAAAATKAVGEQLNGKATKESVEALGKEVDAKADADAIDEVLTRLSERIAGLEGAGPAAPQLTALAIAKAFGAPVFDFSEPRNSALLTL
jgi:hypothetical protein